MVPYKDLSKDAGVSDAFKQIGLGWAELIIAIAGVAGITSVLLVMLLSAPRVFLAMARDGLVPKNVFASVHPTWKTPWISTILIGACVAVMTAFLPIDALLHLTNIGTLFAFVIVCAAVMVMRVVNPTPSGHFAVRSVPVVPIAGILSCLLLMLSLPAANWLRLIGWLAIGLVIYFGYGMWHSTQGKTLRGVPAPHLQAEIAHKALSGIKQWPTNAKREQWGSRIGVILAVAGSAVGLGNFLRFPGLAAQNGGGAFMIPYFVAFLLLGHSAGLGRVDDGALRRACAGSTRRRAFSAPSGRSRTGQISRRDRPGRAADDLHVLRRHRSVVPGLRLVLPDRRTDQRATNQDAYAAFFDDFIGIRQTERALSSRSGQLLRFSLHHVSSTNFVVIYRGLSKGIEDFCKWAMPIMALCALFVLVRVLTLGTPDADKPDQNLMNGLGFMWNPSWARPGRPENVAGRGGADFLHAGRRLRHHHQLFELPATRRRRRAEQPDGQLGERILRGLPGRNDHDSRRVHVPRAPSKDSPVRSTWVSRFCPTSLRRCPPARCSAFCGS